MKTKVISILTRLTMMAFFTAYLTGCDDPVEKVSSVSLDKTTLALKEGENETLKATVLPAGAGNKKITWKSDDSNIASVDQTGKVTAVKAGSTKVTVITADGGKTASCTVTVTAKPKEDVAVTGVTISPSEDTNLKVDSTLEVTAMVEPAGAKDRDVTWSDYDATANPPGSIKDSDDDAKVIATYTITDGKLTVTGKVVGAGTLTVTTTDGSKTADLNIKVVAATPTVVTISLPNGVTNTLTAVDETLQLSASTEPVVDGATFAWTSDNTDVAIVDETTGVVTAVSHGTATITADYEGNKGTIGITVDIVEAVAVTSVTINNHDGGAAIVDPYYLGVGSTLQVMAMVLPEGATNKNVTWSGYDATATPPTGSIKASDDDTEIATYTMKKDTITIKGVALGAGELIVTTTDGNHSDTLNITVASVTISHSNGLTSSFDLVIGKTRDLSKTAEPTVEGAKFSWSSDNPEVATVSVDAVTGVVTVAAVGSGTAKITAMYNGITSNEIEINVPINPTGISIAIASQKKGDDTVANPVFRRDTNNNRILLTTGDVGDVVVLRVDLVGPEGATTDQEVTWSVVSVDPVVMSYENGVIKVIEVNGGPFNLTVASLVVSDDSFSATYTTMAAFSGAAISVKITAADGSELTDSILFRHDAD